MSRDRQAEKLVSEIASGLRAEAPGLFGVPSRGPSVPQPVHQPTREHARVEVDLPPLSSVFAPIQSRLLEEAAERARAADPYEQRRDRLARLAPRMQDDEVLDVEVCLTLARDEKARGDDRSSRDYLEAADRLLNVVERAGP